MSKVAYHAWCKVSHHHTKSYFNFYKSWVSPTNKKYSMLQFVVTVLGRNEIRSIHLQ